MTRVVGRVAAVVAGLATVAVAAGVAAGAWAQAAPGSAGLRTVVVTIHYSHFSLNALTVQRGQTVRFVVRNTDPIDHEFIVGDGRIQDAHERGRDASHDGSIPGQISVPAGAEAATTVTFTTAVIGSGGLQFACHLPAHYAYGMHGIITVRD